MELVKQFKAIDGQVFESKKECEAHELRIVAHDQIEALLPAWDFEIPKTADSDGDYSDALDSDACRTLIAAWIVENFDQVSAILNPPRKSRTAQE